jgi:hypothetical protein
MTLEQLFSVIAVLILAGCAFNFWYMRDVKIEDHE